MLMDAGLSRWLLALGNRTPPSEPTSHRFATTNALLNSTLRRDSTRSRFAPSIRLSQVGRPRAGRAPVAPPPSRLSRGLLRSSQFQRPTASRLRAGTPAPPGRLPGAGGKHRAARAASSPPMRTKPVVLQRPARAPGPLRSGGGRQGARQPRKNKVSGMLMDAGLSRSLLFGRRPATSLRTKTKSVEWTPPGCRCLWAFQRHAARHLPLHFFYFFQGQGDERNKKNTVAGSVVLVPVGWRSVGAFSVSRCQVLFPARHVARGGLGCVGPSPSVSSSSPVVAAVGLRVAASLRLAAVAGRRPRHLDQPQRPHQSPQPLRPGGEEPHTHAHERASRRQPQHCHRRIRMLT